MCAGLSVITVSSRVVKRFCHCLTGHSAVATPAPVRIFIHYAAPPIRFLHWRSASNIFAASMSTCFLLVLLKCLPFSPSSTFSWHSFLRRLAPRFLAISSASSGISLLLKCFFSSRSTRFNIRRFIFSPSTPRHV